MAVAAAIVGLVLHALFGGVTAPFSTFWKAALSNTMASPIGCTCWDEDACSQPPRIVDVATPEP